MVSCPVGWLDKKRTDVSVVHDEVPAYVWPRNAVGLLSALPKLRPIVVMKPAGHAPDVGAFPGHWKERVGASNVTIRTTAVPVRVPTRTSAAP